MSRDIRALHITALSGGSQPAQYQLASSNYSLSLSLYSSIHVMYSVYTRQLPVFTLATKWRSSEPSIETSIGLVAYEETRDSTEVIRDCLLDVTMTVDQVYVNYLLLTTRSMVDSLAAPSVAAISTQQPDTVHSCRCALSS